MKKFFYFFLLLALVAFPPSVHASDLTIDYSLPRGNLTHRASGFEWIFPMNVTALRPYLTPLKPYVIKDPWENQAIALELGATKVQWLVGNYVVSTSQFIPWQEPERWRQYVQAFVANKTTSNESYEWIIWQEPDSPNPQVWQGTPAQFFETWKIAVQEIRSLRPSDTIIGPSPEKFNEPFLKDFLLYAKANNVLPNVLSWHELFPIGNSPYYTGYTPDLIPSHVNTMKQFMANNGIAINRIEITEYQGQDDNYRPGPTVAFIANIEGSGISGTKGNWGINNDPTQLSGLVTSATNPQPRSIWWVYKTYADMTGQLMTTTFASSLNGLGTFDAGSGKAVILAGNQGGIGNKTVEIKNLPSLGTQVGITVDKIPNTERSALASPIRIATYNTTLAPTLTVNLPDVNAWDAYILTLTQTPNSSSKPGDLTGDGRVDGSDLTKLKSNFGNPYTIFDYNALVLNFGK